MRVRDGFTMVEVLVALLIMAIVLLGLQGSAVRYIGIVSSTDRDLLAAQLAEDRIEMVQLDPNYTLLQSRYAGTETNLTGGLSRATEVVRTRDSTAVGVLDYQKVTVTVSGPGLSSPISRTTTVAAP